MAKTLSQIIADSRQHIGQTDATNSNFTDAQLTIWINDAYRTICSVLRHLPIKPRDYSVTGQSIALNAETVTVDTALLKNPDSRNSDGSAKYEEIKVITLDELIAMNPDYASADTDMPRFMARTDTLTAVLYPPPKASVTAQTTPLKTFGLEMPSELSSDSDTPNLPSNLHDIIGHWVAYRCFSELENAPKSTEHITLFNSRLKAHKGLATDFSRKNRGWRWDA